MKCVYCGKETVFEQYCAECYLEKNPLIEDLNEINISACSNCKLLQIKYNWEHFDDFNDGVKTIIKKRLKLTNKVQIKSVRIELESPEYKFKPGIKTMGTAVITVNAVIGKEEVTVHYDVPFAVNFTACKDCGKLGTKYFEGVLQVRNAKPEVMKYIQERISSETTWLNVSKTITLEDGLDFYLSSNKFIQQFGKELQLKFGGQFKVSTRLFSNDRQTSKALYRVSALMRFPDYGIKDIIENDNVYYQITSFSGNKLYATDLITGKNTYFDMGKHEIKVAVDSKNFKTATVCKVKPYVEIIHPDTFQSVRTKNSKDVKPGDEVLVAVIGEDVYLV